MFEDRREAGRVLSQKLLKYRRSRDVVVLAIPRGGVVVAREVSNKLKCPLSVVVVRKIGAPNQKELAIGAVAPEGTVVRDDELILQLGVGEEYIKKEVKAKKSEVRERIAKFLKGRPNLDLTGKFVILVDDGIATGATTEAAIDYLRHKKVKKVVLAIPVAPQDSLKRLRKLVDETVVLETPPYFSAVGEFYRYFPQVSDEEVVQLLQK